MPDSRMAKEVMIDKVVLFIFFVVLIFISYLVVETGRAPSSTV